MCFVSLPALQIIWATFQTKINVRSASASTALAQVLHQSCNTRTANHHLRGCGERNGAQRRSFGRKHWSYMYCGWQKGMSRDEAMSNS